MKKTSLIVLLLVAIVAMSFTVSSNPNPPRYANLKVLPKNTTKEQLDSVMKHFTAALGVKCNFCHVRLDDEQKNWDFASDNNNHKKVAREMMKMTQKINKKFFDVKDPDEMETTLVVNCYTCHKGKPEPVSEIPKPEKKQ